MSENRLLELDNLHTWFELKKWGFLSAGNVKAVDGVSFSINRGEAVSVVGESGCGKSSLAKTILGLYSPEKGKILFEGKPLNSQNSKQMKWYRGKVGFIQQDPYGALPPFMTLKRILEEPMLINGIIDKEERMKRIEDILTELKLTPVNDFIGKYPHMFSGGQQQRAVIARSMILNPDLLIADEPVSMLDASVRIEILKMLQKIRKEFNLAVMYITHDLSTVRYFSEKIMVMYGGKIVERSPVEELLKNPGHPYTVALLRAVSEPDAENVNTFKDVPPGEPPSLLNPPSGCRFHPRCEHKISGLCDQEIPPDFPRGNDHYTACWLYKDEIGEVNDDS
ncbi:MAG: ABC transporter ATP-binding protein [Halanaerobiaceae bacterium]